MFTMQAIGALVKGLANSRRRRRNSGKLPQQSRFPADCLCEALEVRVVMSAASLVVAPTTENSASDFTYSPWNGGIAISSYAGPGGIVRIPATIEGLPVTSILGLGLAGRRDVTSVVLPAGVTALHFNAFAGSSITSISLPASVTFIDRAFASAHRLQSINVDAGNPAFTSVDGVLFTKDKAVLCEYPAGRAGGYAVPEGVEFMREYAFAGRNKLTTVSLPSTLLFVPEYCFAYCQNLREVRITEGVGGIGQFAFRSCPSLASVSLPRSTEYVRYAFFDCPRLRLIDGPATAPVSLRASAQQGGGVRLTWQRPLLADDWNLTVRHYRVEYSADAGKTWRLVSGAPAPETSVVIAGLHGPRRYTFRVTPIVGFPDASPFNTDATVRGQAAATTIIVPGRGLWPR